MVLSTEDYKELMQNIAAKSAAKFSLIPSVASISSQRSEQYPSQMGAMEAHRGLFDEYYELIQDRCIIILR